MNRLDNLPKQLQEKIHEHVLCERKKDMHDELYKKHFSIIVNGKRTTYAEFLQDRGCGGMIHLQLKKGITNSTVPNVPWEFDRMLMYAIEILLDNYPCNMWSPVMKRWIMSKS